MRYEKKTVSVMALFDTDGTITPQCFLWNEKVYKIDNVAKISQSVSKDASDPLLMRIFTCSVQKKRMHLYLINGVWYVNVENSKNEFKNADNKNS